MKSSSVFVYRMTRQSRRLTYPYALKVHPRVGHPLPNDITRRGRAGRLAAWIDWCRRRACGRLQSTSTSRR